MSASRVLVVIARLLCASVLHTVRIKTICLLYGRMHSLYRAVRESHRMSYTK